MYGMSASSGRSKTAVIIQYGQLHNIKIKDISVGFRSHHTGSGAPGSTVHINKMHGFRVLSHAFQMPLSRIEAA